MTCVSINHPSGKGGNLITEYMHLTSGLPPYVPFAKFLLKSDLSLTAMLVYSLLLDRMTLSQRSGWVDRDGHSYVLYPVEHLAEDIGRGQTAVKKALTELTERGLVERKRKGFDQPNRIYVLLPVNMETDRRTVGNRAVIQPENDPADGRKTDCQTVGKQTVIQSENRPSYGRKTDRHTVGKPTPNYLTYPPEYSTKRIRTNIPDYEETEGDSL